MTEAGSLPVPTQVESKRRGRLATRTRLYLFVLAVALPLDYFSPTAALLREGGAKPAIPLMALGSAWIFWRHWPELFFECPKLWRTILLLCIGIAFVGSFAFVVNMALEISYWGGLRDPFSQFVFQGALFLIVAPTLIAHAWLFSRPEIQAAFLRVIPSATLVQLLAVLAQVLGLLRFGVFPLSLFRGGYEFAGSQPTGLMTEPSYMGAFAAMYGLALLLCMPEKRKRDRLLGIAAILLALLEGGKTIVPAMLMGLLAYGYQVRTKLLNWRSLASLLCVLLLTTYFALTYSVLDVQVNLSSAMRIGSTVLALNAAATGLGLLGIGFGQFLFIYTPQFAPVFLTYSAEAQAFFARAFAIRASTYNLPARLLIEEGVLGLVLFLALVRLAFRNGRAHNDVWHRYGAVLAGTSLGYLLTQDPYFYPGFVCGAAILVSQPRRS